MEHEHEPKDPPKYFIKDNKVLDNMTGAANEFFSFL